MLYRALPEKVFFILAFALFVGGGLLRAWQLDFADFDYGIYSDSFINAVTAKNIASGLGWSSSGYETYLLNPENLTTGPTVVLPVAAAVVFFGQTLSLPGLVLFAMNVALLLLLLRSLRAYFMHDKAFFSAALLLLLFFIFFKSYYWYRMIGEMPALLLLLLSATYLQHYFLRRQTQHLVISAVALSLALGAKELVMLPAILLFSVLAAVLYRREKSVLVCAGKLLLYLLLTLSLPIAFSLYQHLVLEGQPENWRSAYYVYANGLHNYYSGITTLREYLVAPEKTFGVFLRVFKSALWNGGTLLHLSFAGLRGIQYWLLTYAVLLLGMCMKRSPASLPVMLGLCALPLLLWYFAISVHGMPRHLFIGLSLAIISTLFFVASLTPDLVRRTAVLLAVALLIYTGDLSSRLALASWPTQKPPNVVALEDMQHHIESLPLKSLSWIGMVDNNEFEFLSTTPNNFRSGFDQIADAVTFDEDAYLSAHPSLKPLLNNHRYDSAFEYYVSPQNRHTESAKVNFTKPLAFDWLHFKGNGIPYYRPAHALDHGDACHTLVYQNAYYVIEHCTTDDIKALFDATGGIPLRPRKWTPWILLPFDRSEVLY